MMKFGLLLNTQFPPGESARTRLEGLEDRLFLRDLVEGDRCDPWLGRAFQYLQYLGYDPARDPHPLNLLRRFKNDHPWLPSSTCNKLCWISSMEPIP